METTHKLGKLGPLGAKKGKPQNTLDLGAVFPVSTSFSKAAGHSRHMKIGALFAQGGCGIKHPRSGRHCAKSGKPKNQPPHPATISPCAMMHKNIPWAVSPVSDTLCQPAEHSQGPKIKAPMAVGG